MLLFPIVMMLSLSPPILNAGEYTPSAEDKDAREALELAVQPSASNGKVKKALSCVLKGLKNGASGTGSAISGATPESVKNLADHCGASVLNKTLNTTLARKFLIKAAFSKENLKLANYDKFGVFRQIPELPVEEGLIQAMLTEAAWERADWEGGKMSGGIYDGSPEHMKELSEYFSSAINSDPLNASLFKDEETKKKLAVEAFAAQQVANPLHGTVFALSVKAMRELGAMLADLVGGRFAIPSSGARESLRVAMRALKLQTGDTQFESNILVIDDDFKLVENAGKTLNLKSVPANSEELSGFVLPPAGIKPIKFIVFNLSSENRSHFKLATNIAENHRLRLHVHIQNTAFQNLVAGTDLDLNRIFSLSRSITSVSFDTSGFFYNGISASVFRDEGIFSTATEAHVHWVGGIYPGLNSAGSIAGIDYILAYIHLLQTGKSGLRDIAQKWGGTAHPCSDGQHCDFVKPYRDRKLAWPGQSFVNEFRSKNHNTKLIHKRLKSYQNLLSPVEWRDELEQILVDVVLSNFNAHPSTFAGRMTSGGTESIRMAMQLYVDRFRRLHPDEQPVFLMTNSAHIAFIRHLRDLNARIIYVNTTSAGTMDLEDLQSKIAEHTWKIAAIVASAPSYPFGAVDPIADIAQIAKKSTLPFHVDGCLGAFVMQFVDDNPLLMNFEDRTWDGVTTWSADPHKYLITQKGLSFLGIRRKLLDPNSQVETICALRSTTTLEVGLACMLGVGYEGYQRRAQAITELGAQVRQGLAVIEEIETIADPADVRTPAWVVAFRLKGNLRPHTYTLGSLMSKLGWHLSQVGEFALHVAITNAHIYRENFLPKFLSDLEFAIALLRKYPDMKKSSSVGVYGMAAGLPDLKSGSEITEVILRELTKSYARNILTVP